MAIPDFQTLMLPLLRLAQRDVSIGQAIEELAEQFGLTSEERAQLLPSGRQATFANRTHWAKTYLAKAGLITPTGRGRFIISPEGLAVLTNPPERITISFLESFPGFREFRERSKAARDPDFADLAPSGPLMPTIMVGALAPDEQIRSLSDDLAAALASDLLDAVRKQSAAFFETLVVRLLVGMGYGGALADAGRALGRSGDGGVDGVIDQDALGLDRVYVQAKRYAPDQPVGPGAIRDFFGGLDQNKANKGVFVTTSSFTKEAEHTANRLSRRIVLVDGEQLARLMIRFNVGCRVVENIEIKSLDEDFFLA